MTKEEGERYMSGGLVILRPRSQSSARPTIPFILRCGTAHKALHNQSSELYLRLSFASLRPGGLAFGPWPNSATNKKDPPSTNATRTNNDGLQLKKSGVM